MVATRRAASLDACQASSRIPAPAGRPPCWYPFPPPAGIGEPLLASLGNLFAGFAAFEFTLDRAGWFAQDVVWLGPRDPRRSPH
ncbi:MAG: hypothetical protein ACRDNS_11725 [Trebonia sp.]